MTASLRTALAARLAPVRGGPLPAPAIVRKVGSGPTRTEVLADGVTLYLGDCGDVLQGLRADAVVTDSPYGLGAHPDPMALLRAWTAGEPYVPRGRGGFMGKEWDAFVPGPELWAPIIDTLPPGGHVLAAFGTRTYDLGALAIRLTGVEIRDMVSWLYGQGFPKSLNVNNALEDLTCSCSALPYDHDETQPTTECDVRSVRHADVPASDDAGDQRGQVLQSGVSEQGAQGTVFAPMPGQTGDGAAQRVVERRGDDAPTQGQLQGGALRQMPAGPDADGAGGRLCDGAPAGHGALGRSLPDAHRNGAPHRSRPDEQPAQQSGALAGQREPQESGAWPACRRCGKPVVAEGLGTALKPACEPWVLARKPLIGTVAANVMAHRAGALHIDACRVGGDKPVTWSTPRGGICSPDAAATGTIGESAQGRWPANVVHDGSPEVLAGFPNAKGAVSNGRKGVAGVYQDGVGASEQRAGYADDGSAARFFYCAKASKRDRDEGMGDAPMLQTTGGGGGIGQYLVDVNSASGKYGSEKAPAKNNHPTVKPEALMRWLCRLITPPGGVVLDPFMGSGSTGKAAVLEGFGFIGIERDPEYFEIALRRVAAAVARAKT